MALCVQVSKLVMELDTSYRWSEQQLMPAQQESSRQAVDTTQHTELIKDAKRLPELRVRDAYTGQVTMDYLVPYSGWRYLGGVR